MRGPDWIVRLFDFNVKNADINSHMQDELIDMCVECGSRSSITVQTQKPA